ncbi:MAG: sugar ABC transporter permease [candidate division KSB1 bacterium]|nr:sugar ABC transporter permease [candidate division KSB1 bacterium]MDQ7065239.1 sugar ABC transporter permease [candidate division KSB1 bacterium]
MTLAELRDNFERNRIAYAYIAPAFLIMGFVVLYPFFYNIVISLSNMNLTHFRDWKFVGLRQYIAVLSEPKFYEVFLKTVLWTVINVFFHVTIGVALALLLNRPLRGRAIFRTLLILPWAVPQYITALTWRGMFNYRYGAINLWLAKVKPVLDPIIDGLNRFLQPVLGLTLAHPPYEWLSSPTGAFAAALITNIWLGFPFMMVVALGGLQSIPNELYEAARVDGASRWMQLRKITLPLLKPVMIPAISLGVIWTFNNFNVIWLVTDGGKPADKTHILVSYVYREVFNYYRYGYAAALSMIIFFILLVFGINFLKRTRATEAVY